MEIFITIIIFIYSIILGLAFYEKGWNECEKNIKNKTENNERKNKFEIGDLIMVENYNDDINGKFGKITFIDEYRIAVTYEDNECEYRFSEEFLPKYLKQIKHKNNK